LSSVDFPSISRSLLSKKTGALKNCLQHKWITYSFAIS
jgi:hypothetical protein